MYCPSLQSYCSTKNMHDGAGSEVESSFVWSYGMCADAQMHQGEVNAAASLRLKHRRSCIQELESVCWCPQHRLYVVFACRGARLERT